MTLPEAARASIRTIRPALPRTCVVELFLGSGFTPSGLYAAFDARLYPVLGRVLSVHPACRLVKPGDVIVYRHVPDRIDLPSGEVVSVMDERAVIAILEGYDDEEVAV